MRCAIYCPKNNFGVGLFNFGVEVLSHISESADKNRSSSSSNNNNNDIICINILLMMLMMIYYHFYYL